MGGYLARQRRSHLFWQIAFTILAVLAIYYLLSELKEVVIPLIISFLLAYLLDPVIDWFERHGVNRTLGVVILLLGVVVATVLFALFFIPLIGKEFAAFGRQIPIYVSRIKDEAIPWVEKTFEVPVPKSFTELTDRFGYSLKELTQQALGPLRGFAGQAVIGAYKLLMILGILVLIPFFTFFFLRDFDKMATFIYGLIPQRHRPWAEETYREIDHALSGWIRGQLLVMLILGTLYSIGYVWVGIPLGLVVGMLTGLLAFVPYLGATVGFLLALAMAFLAWHGWGQIFWVCVVFGTVQTLDAFFITPNILGHGTGVSPAVVVLAFMVFGKLFGIVGVLLAVPSVAVLKVVISRFVAVYRKSAYFTADAAQAVRLTTLSGVPPPASTAKKIKTKQAVKTRKKDRDDLDEEM
jgi:predicted PurR-regulated permease PerM